MSTCRFLDKCPFFNDKMANLPGMATIFKEKYCKGTAEECARYQARVTLGAGKVPADLFPNQHNRLPQLRA
jgi:hypothetical protein